MSDHMSLRTNGSGHLKGLRVFFCTACDHHLRFGRSRCSVCFAPTPLLNRLSVVLGIVLAVLSAAMAGAILIWG